MSAIDDERAELRGWDATPAPEGEPVPAAATTPGRPAEPVVSDGSHSDGVNAFVEMNPTPGFRRMVEERDRYREMYQQAQAARDALSGQNARLAGELADVRERLRAWKLSAAGDESELRHIHETLEIAYGREDLAEETAVVVEAMAAEWKRWRTALETIRTAVRSAQQVGDRNVLPRVVAGVERTATAALGDGG